MWLDSSSASSVISTETSVHLSGNLGGAQDLFRKRYIFLQMKMVVDLEEVQGGAGNGGWFSSWNIYVAFLT